MSNFRYSLFHQHLLIYLISNIFKSWTSCEVLFASLPMPVQGMEECQIIIYSCTKQLFYECRPAIKVRFKNLQNRITERYQGNDQAWHRAIQTMAQECWSPEDAEHLSRYLAEPADQWHIALYEDRRDDILQAGGYYQNTGREPALMQTKTSPSRITAGFASD